jgi:cold shock CspA family protein/ribosome-associated translation inhibitor RaiA
MQLPLQIAFRNMEGTESIDAQIRRRAEDLDHFYDRIMGCRVVVESAHRHHHQGRIYHVRIDLTVPGGEIVVNRDPAEHHAHEDLHVAIRDAFDAARRQLEDHVRHARGQTKTHEAPDHGRIVRLFPAEGYGFIAAADGEEIYMHRNSVAGDAFDKLQIGDEVRYVVHPGEGEKGPQASTVIPVGKHHPSPPLS